MKPRIMIATPCFGGVVHQNYMLSVLQVTGYAATAGAFDVGLRLLGHDALISRARATLVASFMDSPGATHLLFIDADISFQPEQVLRLLAADKEFAGAFYPVKAMYWEGHAERMRAGEPLQEASLKYVGTLCSGPDARTDSNGFATATYVGGGFQLIRRSVFERMFAAYPQTRFNDLYAVSSSGMKSPHLYALFDPIIDSKTGAYLSEDYSFCRRFRDIGGEIWLDLKSRLTHTGAHDFEGNFEARARSMTLEAASLRPKE